MIFYRVFAPDHLILKGFMKLTKRRVVLLAFMMLFIILSSVLTGIAGLTVDNLLPEDDDHSLVESFMATWARISVYQMLSGLMLGISIFTLFVVYLGGRSKHRRFNDRTLDSSTFFGGYFFATALFRAVFVFLFLTSYPSSRHWDEISFQHSLSSTKEVLKHAFNR